MQEKRGRTQKRRDELMQILRPTFRRSPLLTDSLCPPSGDSRKVASGYSEWEGLKRMKDTIVPLIHSQLSLY
ncbi:hypothetical protein AV530_002896 [Patagioenas fasciata monilis]|uniref:Uncharacterized protein n=1 Tax=Patagioenas fasciata monilis TaxID=372326 RepID=A0A1V4K9K4_PATFA|nr:hypothetical protein AV530_002896 [Patagioenas fasciata monilis]